MENLAVARVLAEIADLLEIKGENSFKIRAYRNAASTVADTSVRLADLTLAELLDLPGVGKDIAARIKELTETGASTYHGELAAAFPATLLDLLRLQGIGPKTVSLVYRELGIATVEDLGGAAAEGRLRSIKGLGPKKEGLVLKAIRERQQFHGRHLLADAVDTASQLVAYLQEAAPGAAITPVGSVRRGVETCGDLDILAAGADASIMDAFVDYKLVERVLGRGQTKSSVLLWKGYQADLRLVPRESEGAALQYFTGSKTHNIALRDRAVQRGWRLNEYGLFRNADGHRLAGTTEADIYEALGLAYIPPELREHRGELDAAERHALPTLIEERDILGDVHMHTTATDGRDDIETMVRAAHALGRRYVGITDHSQSLAMANGLDARRALAHAARIREIGRRVDGIDVLAGIECDIRPDGSLDLDDACLEALDLVVASVHSAFQQDEAQMTARVIRAIEHPLVDIIGHATGRLLLRREPYRLNIERVFDAAAANGVAFEINSQTYRLDLNDVHARRAKERGIPLVISTDAHSTHALGLMRWGVNVARRAWLTPGDVLNTLPIDQFLARLRRRRTRPL